MGKPKQEQQPVVQQQPIIPAQKSSGGGSSSSHSSKTVFSGMPTTFKAFQNFSQTGGFSPEDLANIRARAVSPVRAVYANAQREVNRQRSLQGGYSPGFGVLQARMAREQGQGISDAGINAEAGISEMVQKGKLAALQGMAGTEGTTTTTTGSSSSSGGGGGGDTQEPFQNAFVPEEKKGFWGKLWGGLKKVGQVALPVAASAFTGGMAAPIVGGLTKAGQGIGQSIIGGGGKK